MTRKILKILTWIGIAAWFVVILGFVSSESKQVLCNRIDVHLSDTVLHRFVTGSDVRKMLEDHEMQLQGYPIDEIDTRKLEMLLEKNAYIKNAEVSTDISGRLEVNVEQRVPLVRILPEGAGDFIWIQTGRFCLCQSNIHP